MRVVKLSVIVPFYNVQTYAPDTLRSLRANAREDFEFILVDDCSTDGTADMLRRAQDEIPGVVVRRHEQNGGLATARNTGLDAARGEYLAFLDGDDWLAPGFYAELLARTEALDCDFVRTDHVEADGRTRTVQRVPHGRRGEVMAPGTRSCPPGAAPPSTTRTPGRASTTVGCWTAGCCTSRTGCVPPRTGRGSGDCTARRIPSRCWDFSESSTDAASPRRSPRSVTCASSISFARSTRSYGKQRRTAMRGNFCRKRSETIARSFPITWVRWKGSNPLWRVP